MPAHPEGHRQHPVHVRGRRRGAGRDHSSTWTSKGAPRTSWCSSRTRPAPTVSEAIAKAKRVRRCHTRWKASSRALRRRHHRHHRGRQRGSGDLGSEARPAIIIAMVMMSVLIDLPLDLRRRCWCSWCWRSAVMVNRAYMGFRGIGLNVNTLPVTSVGIGSASTTRFTCSTVIREEMRHRTLDDAIEVTLRCVPPARRCCSPP
jgi:hypothetical protein